MGLFGLFGKKNTREPEVKKEKYREYTKEDAKEIAEVIREKFSQPVMRICFTHSAPSKLAASKIGGYPYWEKDKEYPVNSKGDKLVLLCQINFNDEKIPEGSLLPDKGLLQFYIDTDSLMGLNFDDQTKQDGFRIVYFPEFDESITQADVLLMGLPANTEMKDSNLPTEKEYGIYLEEGVDSISSSEESFDDEVRKAIEELYSDYTDSPVYRVLGNECYDELFTLLTGFGSKMLGCPGFTQSDPRDDYDMHLTTLLQLDSEEDMMWGDSGIANFFIDPMDLQKLDFSDVIYNWDCY
ncbi:MAG: DUF1963 domain-containing protein [Clostridia bacterium]|nr:DUF1963 domain-containing protein [Clostridia bacterium]